MDLIEIKTNEVNDQIVSARDLHGKLESKERFSKWFDRMLSYGFVENVDFTPYFLVHPQNKQEMQDYTLTLETAKQICMLQRSDIGTKFRLYFIECEKKLKLITEEQKLVLSIYNGGIDAVESTKKLVELKTKPLLDKIEEDKPLVEFANVCQTSSECVKIGEFVKLLPKEWNMGQNKLFAWFRFNGYLQKNNLPYQKYINDGTFEVKESTFKYKNGDIGINMVTMITPKGQVKLTNKIKSNIN